MSELKVGLTLTATDKGLVATVNKSKGELKKLNKEVGSYGAAKSANVSFEESNSLLQLLATKGIRGARAGTALRNIINKLGNYNNVPLFLSRNSFDELTPALC